MLMEDGTFTGFEFAVAGNGIRQIKIGSINHSGHGFRAEIVIEASVIPENPEFVFFADFVADFLFRSGIFGDDAVERFAVVFCMFGKIHFVVNDLQNGVTIAFFVFFVFFGQVSEFAGRETAFIENPAFSDGCKDSFVFFLCAVHKRGIDSRMGSNGNRELFIGQICELEFIFKTACRDCEQEFGLEFHGQIAEKFVMFIIEIFCPAPCGINIGLVFRDSMASFVEKAVDMIVIGSFLIHRELIDGIRGFENAVSETVGEIECRQTPDFGRL